MMNFRKLGYLMMDSSKYYFGFRQTIPRPPGQWVLCGPYNSSEEAKLEREKAKAPDCQVTVPFIANTLDEAELKMHVF